MTDKESPEDESPYASTKGNADTVSRRNYLSRLMTLSSAFVINSSLSIPTSKAAEITDDPGDSMPLEFGFIKEPPGKLYPLDTHRLHSWSLGSGDYTVLLEPGLGGSSLEWLPTAEQLSTEMQVFLYDRAGYGWSDPGISPRLVSRLARELKTLIEIRGIKNQLILVGHSYGGLIMREFARLAGDQVKGLVLVDASHEDQFTRLADKDGVSMLPTSKHFVISAPELPTGLRPDVQRKILAFSKMRKTYAALHAEIASFKDSCDHIRKQNARFDFPVTVLSRGRNPSPSQANSKKKEAIWQELQLDLLKLSDQSEQRIAVDSGHHIHIDQQQFLIDAIMDQSR